MKLLKPIAALLLLVASPLFGTAQKHQALLTNDTPCTRGFMNVYVPSDGHFLLEVPQKVFGRDIMVSVSVVRGATRQERGSDVRYGYGGDQVYSTMINLRRSGGRLEIVEPQKPIIYHAIDTANIYREYFNSMLQPVLSRLKIVSETDSSCFVDITDIMSADDKLFSLHGAASDLKIGSYQPERSEITTVDAFPRNINFRSIRSYTLANPAKGENPNSSWDVLSSWLLLPEKPLRPQIFDKRVGYFATAIDGLSADANEMGNRAAVAQRWRLEPKPDDMEKYLAGEVVEPQKPIVYYIDRDTPEWLVPYFKKAVEAWQPAFEKAGFKHAIRAELAPDSENYVNGDMRFPLVTCKASPTPNAYGQMVVDPRSGEVLTATVNVFYSVLGLLQRWYFVQCGAVDPRGREYPLPHDIMGRLAATVVTHEVGHTLGLRHNFMGSTVFPTDSLRSPDFIHRNLQGTSVMDYQRFNYVAQPQDGFQAEDLLPKIGAYDEFAIEWGYRMANPALSPFEVERLKTAWTTTRRQDRRTLYLEETNLSDPRVQSEDTGDNAVKAGRLGMENLKRNIEYLKTWNNSADNGDFELRRRLLSTIQQYWNYIGHALKYVGGVYDDNSLPGEKNMFVNEPVSRERETEVLSFLEETVFGDHEWLFPSQIMDKCGLTKEIYDENETQSVIAKLLLKYSTLNKNLQADSKGLTPDELFDYMHRVMFGKLIGEPRLTRTQMMRQSYLLEQFTANAENPSNLYDGIGRKLSALIAKIKVESMQQAESCPDYVTANHYRTLVNFIKVWEAGANRGLKAMQR